MRTCIAYLYIAIVSAIACAVDGLLFPGGQEWWVLWGIASIGMLACALHAIITD